MINNIHIVTATEGGAAMSSATTKPRLFCVDIRAVRDELRTSHTLALNEIETVVLCALDQVAGEAVVLGADEQHDFRTDAVAAKAIALIAAELERVTHAVVRKIGDGRELVLRELVLREPARAAE